MFHCLIRKIWWNNLVYLHTSTRVCSLSRWNPFRAVIMNVKSTQANKWTSYKTKCKKNNNTEATLSFVCFTCEIANYAEYTTVYLHSETDFTVGTHKLKINGISNVCVSLFRSVFSSFNHAFISLQWIYICQIQRNTHIQTVRVICDSNGIPQNMCMCIEASPK